MSIENPFIALHNQAVDIRQSAIESAAVCHGYLKNPKAYIVTDDIIMSSAMEYHAYALSIEKTIAAFPVNAAKEAITSMALLHNIMQAGRHLRQIKPELASDITEQMAQEAYVFRKTGDYVGAVIRVHEFAAAHDSRYRPACNVALDVEAPFYAILHAEGQARTCPREEYGRTTDHSAEVITHRIIGESRLNFVSVLNRANIDIVNYANTLLNRAAVMNHATRLGYIREGETSLSAHFVRQAAVLAQKVANTETGLIGTLAATFEMAQTADGNIPPGPFRPRSYMAAPMPSVFAQLTT